MTSKFIKSMCCDAPINTDVYDFMLDINFIQCIACGALIDYYENDAKFHMDYADKMAGDPLWTWENPPAMGGTGGLPSNREERK